jgi:hypothetical protein
MNCFLDNRYSSTEYNECVVKYHFGATLNRAFSFIRYLRSEGRLLKILIQHNMPFSESMRGWQLVYEDSVCVLC